MSFFTARKVLITGGLGFIGATLAQRLVTEGAKVTVVDSLIPEYGGNLWNVETLRSKIDVNICDVRDEHAMRYLIRHHEFLFNLAGQTSHLDSMHAPFPDLEINARAQLSILEACRHHNPTIKIVFASTRQVYGAPRFVPVTEEHPLQPVDVNGINKIAGESYHILYNNVYGIRSCALRLTNTYGPYMRIKDARQTFLGIWIRRVLEGQPFLVYGDGSQLRDFSYGTDVVDALLLAAASDKSAGQIYNLGADETFSLRQVADLLVSLHPHSSYKVTPFPSELKAIDIGDYYGAYGKISNDLGWKPKVTLARGLRLTLDYYREHLAHYIN